MTSTSLSCSCLLGLSQVPWVINVALQVLAASLHPGGQQAALHTPIAGFLSSLTHCNLAGNNHRWSVATWGGNFWRSVAALLVQSAQQSDSLGVIAEKCTSGLKKEAGGWPVAPKNSCLGRCLVFLGWFPKTGIFLVN